MQITQCGFQHIFLKENMKYCFRFFTKQITWLFSIWWVYCSLTQLMAAVSFYTPWKHQKNGGFLMFSGGARRDSGMKWDEGLKQRSDFSAIILMFYFFLITLKKNSHNTLLSLLSLNITSRTYLFKCKNKIICEICSKLTVKAPERHHWYRPGVFIVNFEQISHTTLVFP